MTRSYHKLASAAEDCEYPDEDQDHNGPVQGWIIKKEEGAAHMGMKVCDINSVTNMAAGIEEFNHESISLNSEKTVDKLEILIAGLIDSLADSK